MTIISFISHFFYSRKASFLYFIRCKIRYSNISPPEKKNKSAILKNASTQIKYLPALFGQSWKKTHSDWIRTKAMGSNFIKTHTHRNIPARICPGCLLWMNRTKSFSSNKQEQTKARSLNANHKMLSTCFRWSWGFWFRYVAYMGGGGGMYAIVLCLDFEFQQLCYYLTFKWLRHYQSMSTVRDIHVSTLSLLRKWITDRIAV